MKYLTLLFILLCASCSSTLKFEKKLKEFLLTPIKTNTHELTEEEKRPEIRETAPIEPEHNWTFWEDMW